MNTTLSNEKLAKLCQMTLILKQNCNEYFTGLTHNSSNSYLFFLMACNYI